MAYSTLVDVGIQFTRLHCSSAGEVGHAEPYLWTAFFKMDGIRNTLLVDSWVNEDGKIVGRLVHADGGRHTDVGPHVQWVSRQRFGHGNIGGPIEQRQSRELRAITDDGREVFRWSFGDLVPIRVISRFQDGSQTDAGWAPGVIGGIAILLERDNTPDDAVLEGARAFLRQLSDGLETLFANYRFDLIDYIQAPDQVGISEEAIDAVRRDISQSVEAAIAEHISENASWWEILKVVTDADDVLGAQFWHWTTGDLQSPGAWSYTGPFESEVWHPRHINPLPGPRYIDLGAWQLFGEVRAERPRPCPIGRAGSKVPILNEILILRAWRDNTLALTPTGRLIIRAYQAVSPLLDRLVASSDRLSRLVRLCAKAAATLVRLGEGRAPGGWHDRPSQGQ